MTSTFNVGGLISGLDTNSMISQLIALERRPLDLLQQQAAKEQAKLDAVHAIRSQLSGLQGALNALLRPSTVNAKSATTSTASGAPTVLTATANSDALNGAFKVTVNQIATATRVTSGAALSRVVDPNATLANAGFRITPITTKDGNPATFSINGKSISVDATTTLNSLVQSINGANADVTATLVADPDGRAGNRVELVGAAGKPIQLGSLGDTSNVLRLLNLGDATVEGLTATAVTGDPVSAGTLDTSVTINGVTTTIQRNEVHTAEENAAFIADAITNTANSAVRATATVDGKILLEQKTLGAAAVIDVTTAGAETGLAVQKTQNGTDRVVSTANLGALDLGAKLADSRLETPIGGLSGDNGQFTINGVAISYNANESIGTILNRINATNAGVTAFYDPTQDRIRLTASQTGARTISLADTTGNFLQATGLLNTTQTLGANAVFSIDGVNNGQPLSSNTNTVSGYIPGVTLTLQSASATPVTVTVGQDTASTASAVQDFVDKVNGVLDAISQQTAYDTESKQASTLTGDSSILGIARQLRSLIASPAYGASGKYQSLADLGVSTGAVGSAVGTTSHLTVNSDKLAAALRENPQAVLTVFSGFTATLGATAGTGNVVTATGTPTKQHENGTYHVKVVDASNKVEVSFVTPGGRTLSKTPGILTPGVDNSSLIPGVTLKTAGALQVGEDTVALTVGTRGVAVGLGDYLNDLLGANGFFANRDDASAAVTKSLTQQIADGEVRLQAKQDQLTKKFSALETVMAQFQSQTSALSSAIAQLPSTNK
jgi:flagellar hook-associated protein 2